MLRRVILRYTIKLHYREAELIQGLVHYFQSLRGQDIFSIETYNYIYKSEKDKSISFIFTKFSDIIDIIIPFFDKYPILGIKSLDFADFKKVAEIVKNKKHLTTEGYNEVVKINSTMNQRRPWS